MKITYQTYDITAEERYTDIGRVLDQKYFLDACKKIYLELIGSINEGKNIIIVMNGPNKEQKERMGKLNLADTKNIIGMVME